jgi:hypothetical protein
VNLNEPLLPSIATSQHDYIIGTQDSIVTQVQFRIILKVPHVPLLCSSKKDMGFKITI